MLYKIYKGYIIRDIKGILLILIRDIEGIILFF